MPWHPTKHDGAVKIGKVHRATPTRRDPHDHNVAYGRAWKKLRAAHAANVPAICVGVLDDGTICGKALPSRQMHLDHVVPRKPGDVEAPETRRQWLCESCHAKKTRREAAGCNAKPKTP